MKNAGYIGTLKKLLLKSSALLGLNCPNTVMQKNYKLEQFPF